MVQLNIQTSEGSAAKDLKPDGKFYATFFRSSSQNATTKEILKSVYISQILW